MNVKFRVVTKHAQMMQFVMERGVLLLFKPVGLTFFLASGL